MPLFRPQRSHLSLKNRTRSSLFDKTSSLSPLFVMSGIRSFFAVGSFLVRFCLSSIIQFTVNNRTGRCFRIFEHGFERHAFHRQIFFSSDRSRNRAPLWVEQSCCNSILFFSLRPKPRRRAHDAQQEYRRASRAGGGSSDVSTIESKLLLCLSIA